MSRNCLPIALLIALGLMVCAAANGEEYSDLWGGAGEKWTPQSRLPDFSYAGYRCGEKPIPHVRSVADVKSFGAKGDGQTDDSVAFLKALESVTSGAIEIPPGRYRITQILEMNKRGVVLRGAGPEKTILYFPTPLNEIRPDWGQTTGGRRTSNYSWWGGFVWMKSTNRPETLAAVAGEARRGDTALRVDSARKLHAGRRIEITQRDDADNSLARYLYSHDAGDVQELRGRTTVELVCRIKAVQGNVLQFDRPLRFDVRPAWKPEVRSFDPPASEMGLENLGFEFPALDYRGHFTELGYNAVCLDGVSDCWVRNIRIVNADSGLFAAGWFCTIDGVVFESVRKPDSGRNTGHHGIYFCFGYDNLFANFDFRTTFIHDISVSRCAGNVCSNGRGVNLCFDHHRQAPYEDLFTNIDVGAGTRPWSSSGGNALGKHCAARETFWNIRAQRPLRYPPAAFGPLSINVVAVDTREPSEKDEAGKWFEAIPPDQIVPPNLYRAQLARRLGAR